MSKQEDKQAIKTIVKVGSVDAVVISQFCPETVEKKNNYSTELRKLFLSQPEFVQQAKEFEELDNVVTKISENKGNIKVFEGKINKLTLATGAKLRQEALSYCIETNGLNDEDLRNILINKVKETHKLLSDANVGLEETKNTLTPLRDAFQKKFSEFSKARKAEFRTWKTANMPQNKEQLAALKKERKLHKKATPEYCVATNQILKLSDPTEHLLAAVDRSDLDEFTKTSYKLRINKDHIASQSTRFSDSGRYIGAYIRTMVASMVDELAAVNNTRFKEEIANSANAAKVTQLIELVDFDTNKFSASVEKSIYENIVRAVQAANAGPVTTTDPAYDFYVSIKNYAKTRRFDKQNKIPAMHDSVVAVIARSVYQFIVVLCSMIKDSLKRTGINTIQSKVVESILDPYYRFAGVAHPELAKKVTKKKASSA